MPLVKALAKNDSLGFKLVLRENFYKRASNSVELVKLVFNEGTTFQELAAGVGTKPTILALTCLIQNFCSQFNFGPNKNMTVSQAVDLAADLATSFIDRKGNAVRFEEIAIFFDKAGKNEFKKKNGQPFIFDRIDRLVIEEMMDHYFETDRTHGVWALEDEKAARARQHLDLPRISQGTGDDEFKPIDEIFTTYAGQPGTLALKKLINEAAEKYGSNDREGIPGNDINAGSPE
jgi:hypothetical protein